MRASAVKPFGEIIVIEGFSACSINSKRSGVVTEHCENRTVDPCSVQLSMTVCAHVRLYDHAGGGPYNRIIYSSVLAAYDPCCLRFVLNFGIAD